MMSPTRSFDLGLHGEGEPLPDDIAGALREIGAQSFITRLVYASDLPSTNDLATGLARQGAAEGTLVLADHQSAGRGRAGRSWFSPAGAGLYLSVIFRGERLELLTLMTGVALAESIRTSTGLTVELKWPNDLVVRDPGARLVRKIGGVLAEASGSGSSIEFVVVGCGLNVRAAAGVPPEVAARATSIEGELGRGVDRGMVFAQAVSSIGAWRTTLLGGDEKAILDRWRELAPSHRGAPVETDGRRRGTVVGIDARGALLVRVNDRIERIVAGDVRWLGL